MHCIHVCKCMLTICKWYALQLSFYDQFKFLLMKTGFFRDNIVTHFSASFLAVSTFSRSFGFSLISVFFLSTGCGKKVSPSDLLQFFTRWRHCNADNIKTPKATCMQTRPFCAITTYMYVGKISFFTSCKHSQGTLFFAVCCTFEVCWSSTKLILFLDSQNFHVVSTVTFNALKQEVERLKFYNTEYFTLSLLT